jgi:hypothetical protein
MALLLDEDYVKLEEMGVTFCEEETQRFLVIRDYMLPKGIYTVATCNILIIIPSNYNQAGNDMFWTYPRLERADGKPITRTNNPGQNDNRQFEGNEYCRWSRHWNEGASVWRPGSDDVSTIQRRIEWALNHPDAK